MTLVNSVVGEALKFDWAASDAFNSVQPVLTQVDHLQSYIRSVSFVNYVN